MIVRPGVSTTEGWRSFEAYSAFMVRPDMSGKGNSTPQTERGRYWPYELYTPLTKLFARLDEDLTSRTALGVEQRYDGVE